MHDLPIPEVIRWSLSIVLVVTVQGSHLSIMIIFRLESIMLNYYSIPEFFHAIAFIPMQVLLLFPCKSCYYAQIMLIS